MFRVASSEGVETIAFPQSIYAFRSQSFHDQSPITRADTASTTQNAAATEKRIEKPHIEESEYARLDKLGRARPAIFKSTTKEILFVFSITMSQIITEFFVSGFTVILPTLIKDLDIPTASSVWPATAFSLVIASTLLFFGRLGDMYGGYPVFIFGLAWLFVWSIIAGFSTTPLMLDFCRALQGIGAAAYLPTGVMLLGSVYRPGPRKNLVFSIYGTSAVIGFFVGIFFAGVVGQFIHWGWYFWIGSAIVAVTMVTAIFAIPNDNLEKRKQKKEDRVPMDYWGALTIVSGLVLSVFAITESSHAPHGWRTPYIPVLLVVGILLLCLAAYVEGWVAKAPLLPGSIFQHKSMTPLIISMLFLYGTLGIFLVYGTQYFENIMGASPLQVVAWYVPMVMGGLALSTAGGFLLHRLPAKPLLIISGCGALGSSLLLALVPVGGKYWAYIMPAMILGTTAIDIAYNMTNIYLTTQLPSSQQGLAGGLINSILQLGITVLLGFADIVQSETLPRQGLRRSYKNTFWLGTAAGATALLMNVFLVHIPKAKSDYTADEKNALREELRREEGGENTKGSEHKGI
jgi:MFS family permease